MKSLVVAVAVTAAAAAALVLAGCHADDVVDAQPDAAPVDAEIDAPPACVDGPTGTQHGVALTSGGLPRSYFLHVPATTHCTEPSPLWIDFHGTAGDVPEEAYDTPEAIAVADREHVILVRPRSRSSMGIYQWDIHAGDLALNRTFVKDLVAALSATYAIDASRIYVTGFSSGTNMASQYLRSDELPVAGIGAVGGGYWTGTAAQLSRIPARVYTVTGFRDYMVQNFDPLRDLLRTNPPSGGWFERQADAGHALYGWHLDEMMPFLLRGERPATGTTLAAPWLDESIPTFRALLDVTPLGAPDSDLIAVGSEGAAYRRTPLGDATAGGTWSAITTGATARQHFTSACVTGSTVYATAQDKLFRSTDGGVTFAPLPAVPELETPQFGVAFLEAVDCAPTRTLLASGWWSSVESTDDAAHWTAAPMPSLANFQGITVDLARATDGTAMAVGLAYVGIRHPGGAFTAIDVGGEPEAWFDAVATDSAGHWWIAGEHGIVRHSTDDGATWPLQSTGTTADLYAVAFHDAQLGAIAGAHGTVRITRDGGATWQDVSLGIDRFVGAVHFLSADTLLVVGEHGLAARLDLAAL